MEEDSKPEEKYIKVEGSVDGSFGVAKFFDNGRGIEDDNLDKLFDYTFTTKGERGMGFGLAIARRLVAMHNGRIEVATKWGFFSEFRVMLPLRTK